MSPLQQYQLAIVRCQIAIVKGTQEEMAKAIKQMSAAFADYIKERK